MNTIYLELRQTVQSELDNFEVPQVYPEAVGSPLPSSWFYERLADMRTALVIPYAAKICDCAEGTGKLVIVDVVIVADDRKGTIVAYDPQTGTFVLTATDPDPDCIRGVDAVSCGVRGSTVDCFLSA